MTIANNTLNLLTFTQRWVPASSSEPAYLSLNILVVPRGDPLKPLGGSTTAFADAALSFDACIVSGLDTLPDPTRVAQRTALTVSPPANRRALLKVLGKEFRVHNVPGSTPPMAPPTPLTRPGIRKFLAPSYQAATKNASPRTKLCVTNDAYDCMLRDTRHAVKPDKQPDNRFYWEEVFAFALRQPLLARECGLIYQARLPINDPGLLAAGGFVFVELGADCVIKSGDPPGKVLTGSYAARIPALKATGQARALFTPVLFPLSASADFDEVTAEAADFASGFARIVHGAQPQRAAQVDSDGATLKPGELAPPKDAGIQLGWDDEQTVVWHNRQFGTNAYALDATAPDAPLGVAGYRVDVRENKPGRSWQSMTHVHGDLRLEGIGLGAFDGELTVDVLPVNHTLVENDGFWLPSYFTSWRGSSLVVTDPLPFQIANHPQVLHASPYKAIGDNAVPLRYGRNYQFRVRLADLTGGGPLATDAPEADAPMPAATIPFRRSVPPGAVTLRKGDGLAANKRTATYRVSRPRLGYPDIAYTGFPNAVGKLLSQARAESVLKCENTLPDPDAGLLQIEVQVRTLAHDPDAPAGSPAYISLYSTTRPFPNDPAKPLTLSAIFEDLTQLTKLQGLKLSRTAPLRLPSARDIRLVLTPLGAPDKTFKYWRSDQARVGAPTSAYLRAPGRVERDVLLSPEDGRTIQGIYLQPDRTLLAGALAEQGASGLRQEAFTDIAERLAAHLHLSHDSMSFRAKPGVRMVFGAADRLLHTLNPDCSSITFSSRNDLTRHWLVPIRLRLNRDWTWDGLAPQGLEIRRDGASVGFVRLPRILSSTVAAPFDREHAELLFFDVVDPKPQVGQFPQELRLRYEVVPHFASKHVQTDPIQQWQLRLPVTTPPSQTPRLISAGIAFSEFQRGKHYESTGERRRMLYFEFDRPPDDPDDRYFARVLASAPDPMLTRSMNQAGQREPPLPVDPEPLRFVVPDASNDSAGWGVMQQLAPGADDFRYLLPLPEGLSPESPELFGFFTYELRLGHANRWCTAQGRYGLPLRVAGVQHPAPQLRCSAVRDNVAIQVLATFAAPVLNGRNVRPAVSSTSMHALLYAQVQQADGLAWRNVLLHTTLARLDEARHDQPDVRLDRLHQRVDKVEHRFDQAVATFSQNEIVQNLRTLGLPVDAPLSVIAVEMLPEPTGDIPEPLSDNLGSVRIYRTSPLTPVPAICSPLPF